VVKPRVAHARNDDRVLKGQVGGDGQGVGHGASG
jgi:hypothetical protein